MSRRYAPYAALVAQAGPRTELWRTLFGLIFIAVATVFIAQLFAGVVGPLIPGDPRVGNAPDSMLFMLFSFGCFGAAVVAVSYTLHERGLRSLVGPRWGAQFLVALFAATALMIALTVLPPYGYGAPLEPGLPVRTWLGLLPLSLLAVFVQSSAEELLFRGYLQQQLAARFSSPLVWMLIPSVLFAAGHAMPGAEDNGWIIFLWAGLFGVLMADLTARTGSLGPAMAVHFLNNVMAILIVSFPDELDGLALFQLPFGLDEAETLWLSVDFATMLTTWLGVRLALRR